MAHHQHHGVPQGPMSASPQTASTTMPSISEDELAGEADEPPDPPKHHFSKTTLPPNTRRPSLLTKALHTDSESHDESLGFSSAFRRQTSRSSTCSTWSGRTDAMSDDAPMSSPTSPIKPFSFTSPSSSARPSESREHDSHVSPDRDAPLSASSVSPKATPEPTVEQKLGRKRCIMFACGRQPSEQKPLGGTPSQKPEPTKEPEPKPEPAPRRPCALKFICPSKVSSGELESSKRPSRDASPPPPQRFVAPSPNLKASRPHRDSDTTIKNDSPKTIKKIPPMEPRKRLSQEFDDDASEATRFYEFAGRGQQVDNWVKEATCHRSRLTVDDTLAKEKNIRQIGDEAEEEALQEEELDDALSGAVESDEDDDISDTGFQTDDEDGFAESDDEQSEDESDYDWWSARRSSPARATMAPGDALRAPAMHSGSISSLNSIVSPKHRDLPAGFPNRSKAKGKSRAIPIRAPSPELPDSTDFVCGTLDEDKPLEQAYMSCIEQRRLAKQPRKAQDFDPTFPDEPMDLDDEEDDDDVNEEVEAGAHEDSNEMLPHGEMEDLEDDDEAEEEDDDEIDEPRGRGREPKGLPSSQSSHGHQQSHTPRTASVKRIKSPMPPSKPTSKPTSTRPKSPMPGAKAPVKRIKSPMPSSGSAAAAAAASKMAKPTLSRRGTKLRSPPPRALFGHSPRRLRSPPPATRLTSPPPSRRGSPINIKQVAFGTAFLGQRPQLTHTTSLPRSPNPFAYKRAPFAPSTSKPASDTEVCEVEDDEEEEEDDTATETNSGYTRGAIDIVQGLERKRLRRRQKFYEKYCRKEEKKRERGELKRPLPGKGAQRMRQVGIGCAIYRGKRVLSV